MPAERRAIVVGAGISGLAAAGALARHFDDVVLVERDACADGPAERPGVPQGRHAHALLVKGRRVVDDLFPGVVEQLVADGARWFDYGGDTVLRVGGHAMPRAVTGVRALACTRGLLEFRIRERLLADGRVRLLSGTRVGGLVLDGAGRRVTGVRVGSRGGASDETLTAGLVVAASGRSAQVCRWLEDAGFGRPRESVVDARVGYASRLYALPAHAGNWQVVGLGVTWPDERRGGAMLKVEAGRLLVTLVGAGGDHPPSDERSFLEFASCLADPIVHRTIEQAVPLTPVATYRALRNRRRHFEELARWPERLVALGDAVCVFNPIYAQGMTVGLGAAALLGERLAAVGGALPDGFAASYQRELARALRLPWRMATTEDRWWASEHGEPVSYGDRASRLYVRRLQAAMAESPALARRFLHVMHMTRSPATLFTPPVLVRLLRTPAA